MTIVSSRAQYLDTGLKVLADLGYGGLKLAEICDRLGVTTGSFYHRFSNWKAYTDELGRYWIDTQTDELIAQLWEETDPRQRLEQLAGMMLTVPHRSEAAFRVWAAVDPEMRVLLAEADRKRLNNITNVILAVLPDEAAARRFAHWAMYTMIGYQDALIDADPDALAWMKDGMVALIYSAVPADGAGG